MFQEEVDKHDLDVHIFYAVEDKNPKISFCKSQIEMLKWFLETGKETVLCLEDDVYFKSLNKLQQVFNELPNDWQMLYLGANAKPYDNFIPAEYYSEHLRLIRSCFCTHGVAYKRELVKEIVESYEYIDGQLFDTWLDIHILKTRDVFITVPMMAYQKSVRSDLWGVNVNYVDIFLSSDQYLQSIR
jgi:GR25 family glycosyltransferase involved in LPS biosynthesis